MNVSFLVDENTQLLLPRWRFLRNSADTQAYRYLGLTPEAATELRSLDETQVLRAADASLPLFRSAVNSDLLVKLLTTGSAVVPGPLNSAEQLIEAENEFWLANRWSAAQK